MYDCLSSSLTSVPEYRTARFVSPPEIGPLDGRTVFPAVEVSPRVIVAIRHSVLVAILIVFVYGGNKENNRKSLNRT